MSSMGYMNIEGAQQGHIEGSSAHREADGLIEIFAFDHEVAIPRNAATALIAGRPVHHEIMVRKLVDRATPRLYQALDRQEQLTEVSFDWHQYSPKGIEERVFRIELRNALVTRIKPSMADALDPTMDRYRFMEQVSLAYEHIVWIWGGGDVRFEATWEGPEAGS